MNKKFIWVLLSIGLFSLPLTTYAAGYPVIDIEEIIKTMELIEQTKDEVSSLGDIKGFTKQQLNFLQQDIAGNFGYGNLLNNPADLAQRQWSNDNWIDVLNMVNTDKTSAFYQAQRAYAQRYQILNPNQFSNAQGVSALTKQFYSDNSNISRAGLAASSYSYGQINQHMQVIHDILQKLETQPSEKAAIDLNTRLIAELSFIELEKLRMQNIQTQIASNNSQAVVNGMSDQASFMQWNP